MKPKYKIIIEWSQQDDCYVVSLPDFNVMQPCTHGHSYQEALDNAKDVIDLLEDVYDHTEQSLPEPATTA